MICMLLMIMVTTVSLRFLGRVDFSVLVLLGALLCSILATLSLK